MKDLRQKSSGGAFVGPCAALAVALLVPACVAEVGGDASEPSLEQNTSALNTAKFHGWSQIPNGTFSSGPAVTSRASSHIDVFGSGMDNVIYSNSFTSSFGWSGWFPVGTQTFVSRPAVTTFPDQKDGGMLEDALVAINSAGAIMINVSQAPSRQFGGWLTIPGSAGFTLAPAIAYDNHNQSLDVFGVKADQKAYYSRSFIGRGFGNSWTAWQEVPGGGLFSSAPSATAMRVGGLNIGHVVLAGRGLDNRFWVTEGSGPESFNGWHQLAGTAQVLAPAIASQQDTLIDIFGGFANDSMAHVATVNPSVASTPTFSTVAGGVLNTPFSATWRADNGGDGTNLDPVGRGTDNACWVNSWF